MHAVPQFLNDTAEQHRFTRPWVALDPKEAGIGVTVPMAEGSLRQNPGVRVSQQATLDVFYALLVMPWVGNVEISDAECLFALGIYVRANALTPKQQNQHNGGSSGGKVSSPLLTY